MNIYIHIFQNQPSSSKKSSYSAFSTGDFRLLFSSRGQVSTCVIC